MQTSAGVQRHDDALFITFSFMSAGHEARGMPSRAV
jgi:hypothetical protein